MAAGDNLNYGTQRKLWVMVDEILGRKSMSRGGSKVERRISYKAGVPMTNTEADCPLSSKPVGEICVDTTNSDVYVCTAYTNTTTFTWTKISS